MHPHSCCEQEKVGMRDPYAAAESGLLMSICEHVCVERDV